MTHTTRRNRPLSKKKKKEAGWVENREREREEGYPINLVTARPHDRTTKKKSQNENHTLLTNHPHTSFKATTKRHQKS